MQTYFYNLPVLTPLSAKVVLRRVITSLSMTLTFPLFTRSFLLSVIDNICKFLSADTCTVYHCKQQSHTAKSHNDFWTLRWQTGQYGLSTHYSQSNACEMRPCDKGSLDTDNSALNLMLIWSTMYSKNWHEKKSWRYFTQICITNFIKIFIVVIKLNKINTWATRLADNMVETDGII